MRFTSQRDYTTMLKINKELVNRVIDTNIVLYKLHQEQSTTNSYGESVNKVWYVGVVLPGLINRQPTQTTANMSTIDVEQTTEFAFLRTECAERNIYPEIGDIVHYHDDYFEINNVNEVQLYAGQIAYNHQILCAAHLTRVTNLQLERPRI